METHFGDYSVSNENVEIHLDFSKYDERIKKAQFWLDTQVMTDMVPVMPRQTGAFVQLTRARSAAMAGSGVVCAGTPPMGRFLYYGKVMVDPVTRSPFARPGVKKVVTDRDLHFWYPGAQAKWFEVAKEQNIGGWTHLVEKILKGGQ